VRSTADREALKALSDLLDRAVAAIVRDEDWAKFNRWLEEELRAGKLPQVPAEPEAARMLGCALGRAIWNATPLPGNGFRPRPIASPGRNDPCLVGLGCKHKQCCGGGPPLPRFSTDEIWESLCRALPAAKLGDAALAGNLPPAALGVAGHKLVADGDANRARRLLEPLFPAHLEALDERFEAALDALCDAYGELGQVHKKQTLLERVAHGARPGLRAPAWARLAAVFVDAGQQAKAWAAFREAQRLDPDSPELSSLEVTMLLAEGRSAQAAERAAFWSRRLRQLGYDDPDFLAHLDALARSGGGATGGAFLPIAGEPAKRLHAWLTRHQGRAVPVYRAEPPAPFDPADEEGFLRGVREHLMRLGVSEDSLAAPVEALRRQLEALAKAPPPERERSGDAEDESTRRDAALAPPSAMGAVEDAWRKVYPAGKPMLVALEMDFERDPWGESVGRWLDFLEAHPEAFDSLEILDDLATALGAHPMLAAPWARAPALAPLLARASAIVDAALAAHPAATLPWAMPANRAALRLLVRRTLLQMDDGEPHAAESLRRLLALNPGDNHGLRGRLANLLLQRGEDEAALELIARYPNDVDPAIRFGAVLAWYRKGDSKRAARELRRARRDLPLVPGYLVAARRAEPRRGAFGITRGGPDEAWLYREEMRDVWAGVPGLLDWLKRTAR